MSHEAADDQMTWLHSPKSGEEIYCHTKARLDSSMIADDGSIQGRTNTLHCPTFRDL